MTPKTFSQIRLVQCKVGDLQYLTSGYEGMNSIKYAEQAIGYEGYAPSDVNVFKEKFVDFNSGTYQGGNHKTLNFQYT